MRNCDCGKVCTCFLNREKPVDEFLNDYEDNYPGCSVHVAVGIKYMESVFAKRTAAQQIHANEDKK